MIANAKLVRGIDIPMVKLFPRHERKVARKYSKRIGAESKSRLCLLIFSEPPRYNA